MGTVDTPAMLAGDQPHNAGETLAYELYVAVQGQEKHARPPTSTCALGPESTPTLTGSRRSARPYTLVTLPGGSKGVMASLRGQSKKTSSP